MCFNKAPATTPAIMNVGIGFKLYLYCFGHICLSARLQPIPE